MKIFKKILAIILGIAFLVVFVMALIDMGFVEVCIYIVLYTAMYLLLIWICKTLKIL